MPRLAGAPIPCVRGRCRSHDCCRAGTTRSRECRVRRERRSRLAPGRRRCREQFASLRRRHARIVGVHAERTRDAGAEEFEHVLGDDFAVVVDADHMVAVFQYHHACLARALAGADLLHQEVGRVQAGQLVQARVHDQRRASDSIEAFITMPRRRSTSRMQASGTSCSGSSRRARTLPSRSRAAARS